jgi:hypothetical protein
MLTPIFHSIGKNSWSHTQVYVLTLGMTPHGVMG